MEEYKPNTQPPRLDKSMTIHQLNEPVPIALQSQFFAQVRHRREEIAKNNATQPKEEELLKRIEQVLGETPQVGIDRLMLYFAHLSCLGSVEALRFAQELCQTLTGDRRYLALMAELEIRMHLYEDLTENPQAIIASGLGGEGELIRLNGVVFQRHFLDWEAYQKDLLSRSLQEMCKAQGGRIEEELWGVGYFGFRILIPYYTQVQEVIEELLNECNQYGQFLNPDCHVSNTHLLTHEIINELIEMRQKPQEDFGTHLKKVLDDIIDKLGTPPDTEE